MDSTSEFPPEGQTPEDYDAHIQKEWLRKRLEEKKRRAVGKLTAGPKYGGVLDELTCYAEAVVEAAAEFFSDRPGAVEDFCVQSGHLFDDDVVVFGGTNRLQWSLNHGFRYSPSHCIEPFIARFREIMGGDRTF